MHKKHAIEIRAWLDGEQIQFYDYDKRKWIDIQGNPSFSESFQYRVKPKTLVFKRLVTLSSDFVTLDMSNVSNVEFEFDANGNLVNVRKI